MLSYNARQRLLHALYGVLHYGDDVRGDLLAIEAPAEGRRIINDTLRYPDALLVARLAEQIALLEVEQASQAMDRPESSGAGTLAPWLARTRGERTRTTLTL